MHGFFSINLASLQWRQSGTLADHLPLCDACDRFITPEDRGFPILRAGGREKVLIHYRCAKQRTRALLLCPRNRFRS